MTLDELNKLDLKTLADWPLPSKLAALVSTASSSELAKAAHCIWRSRAA